MATAAPAAPSQSAPSAQPAPGPATDAAGGPSATPAPAPEAAPRLAKPVRPIPSLPGVFSDDDPFPIAPPPSKSAATSDPAKGSGPVRGPDGRFLPGTSSPGGTDTGEHALEAATQPPPPTAARFKFGGEEFATQAEAEQNFRSLRGQFKPIQALARSLGGVEKILPNFQTAAESARGWKAEHDRVAAELHALRTGAQPARTGAVPSTAPTDAAPAAEAADVDWELYAEVKKLAADSGEPWKAEQWLIEQVRAADEARYRRMLDERLQPLADQEAQSAAADQTESLFSNLSEYTNSDGSPAFPELHDEQSAYEVGKLWASLGLPPEAALTAQGAIAAIAIHRMAKANRQLPPQASPAAVAAATPQASAPPADARTAASMDDGRPMRVSTPTGDAPSAEAARILAGLRAANSGNRAVLGFDA